VTASNDQTARVWDLTPDQRPVDDLLKCAQLLANRKVDPSGDLTRMDAPETFRLWEELCQKYAADFTVSGATNAAGRSLEAARLEQLRKCEAIVAQLTGTIEMEGARNLLWVQRGRAHVALQQWARAANDFAAAVSFSPEDPNPWCERGAALLLSDNQEAYRHVCELALRQFAKSDDSRTICFVARLCVLAPNAVADLNRPLEMARRAVSVTPDRAWFLHTLGIICFRAGQFGEAERSLRESMKVDPTWKAQADNWLLLAMTCRKLGRADEARRWFNKAVNWIDRTTQRMTLELATGLPMDADDWMACQLLRREATKMLTE
jgi:Flp pilus assembly protein TadD